MQLRLQRNGHRSLDADVRGRQCAAGSCDGDRLCVVVLYVGHHCTGTHFISEPGPLESNRAISQSGDGAGPRANPAVAGLAYGRGFVANSRACRHYVSADRGRAVAERLGSADELILQWGTP